MMMVKTHINKNETSLPVDAHLNLPVLAIKRAVGQPTKYKASLCKDLVNMMAAGKKDCQIFAEWGLGRATFYKWLREIPEFKEAHDIGLELAEKWWEDEGKRLMLSGDSKAFNFWIAFMNRKFGWSKNNTNSESQTQININNMNVLNTKSTEDLEAFILEKMQDLNIGYDDQPKRLEANSKDQDQSGAIIDSGSFEDPFGQEEV